MQKLRFVQEAIIIIFDYFLLSPSKLLVCALAASFGNEDNAEDVANDNYEADYDDDDDDDNDENVYGWHAT